MIFHQTLFERGTSSPRRTSDKWRGGTLSSPFDVLDLIIDHFVSLIFRIRIVISQNYCVIFSSMTVFERKKNPPKQNKDTQDN